MKTVCWLAALLLMRLGAMAQPSDYAFQQYSTDHGLPNEEVSCILKDKRGFMWFGTLNGLARFDGIRFTVYRRTGEPNQLINNYIIGMTQDTLGYIWVSTHRGLSRLNPLTEQFASIALPTQRDQTSDNDYVSRIVIDQQGFGWFSTVNHLNRMNLAANRPRIRYQCRVLMLWSHTSTGRGVSGCCREGSSIASARRPGSP